MVKKSVLIIVAVMFFGLIVKAQKFEGWSWNSGKRFIDDNSTIYAGDVNGDRKIDLITVGQAGASNAGVVYVGYSNGTSFHAWGWNSGSRLVDDKPRIAIGDVNGDGKADLVNVGQVGQANEGYVYVSISDGFGYKTWIWNSGAKWIDNNSSIYLGDVNGDGKADLITVGQAGASNAGVVYVGYSNGTSFHAWSWNSGTRLVDDKPRIAIGDVNGDGKADLVNVGQAGQQNAGYVYVSLSDGFGYKTWDWNSGKRFIDDNSDIWVGDVNNDRKADLITKGEPSASNAGFVYIGLSSGNSFNAWTWNTGSRLVDDKARIVLGDVNGDRKLDLINVGQAGQQNAGFVYISLTK